MCGSLLPPYLTCLLRVGSYNLCGGGQAFHWQQVETSWQRLWPQSWLAQLVSIKGSHNTESHTESLITYRVPNHIQSPWSHTESLITYRVLDPIQSPWSPTESSSHKTASPPCTLSSFVALSLSSVYWDLCLCWLIVSSLLPYSHATKQRRQLGIVHTIIIQITKLIY